jgi:CubicO group peptidase (beta-lactamase class C family)
MMGTNMIPASALVASNGNGVARFNEAVGFGLDFMVVNDPRAAGTLEGKGSMSWGGAAGTWFWVDPTNDVIFVGMIQRMGDTGGDPLGSMARTLTYQALTHPERSRDFRFRGAKAFAGPQRLESTRVEELAPRVRRVRLRASDQEIGLPAQSLETARLPAKSFRVGGNDYKARVAPS